MSTTLVGPVDWGTSRDREGYREYDLTWLIEVTNQYSPSLAITDPADISETAGLPTIGSSWSDLSWITGSDAAAWCTPEYEIRPYGVIQGEAPTFYTYKSIYSTRPFKKCSESNFQNPLFEPPEISGSWVDKKFYPYVDRDGNWYVTRAGERLEGSITETDDSDWELNISFNSLALPLDLINDLRHHLNISPMWGLPVATIKFSKYSFSRKFYGRCFPYYNNSMGFSIRPDWNQYIPETSEMELVPGGNPQNPKHWIRRKDVFAENVPRLQLDTAGLPFVDPNTQTMSVLTRKPYFLGNLFLLGVPSSL